MSSWSVVVPTVRPEKFQMFLQDWQPLFDRYAVHLIVVEDQPQRSESIQEFLQAHPRLSFEHHYWGSLPKFIPTRTDMVRSWGIYRAWLVKSTFTVTLDDDVMPSGDLFAAYQRVFEAGAPCSPYLDVGALTTGGRQLRGFPFRDRTPARVAVQYGGWDGMLDYDAPTQLAGVNANEVFHPVVLPVPRGAAVTGCIMNAAWRTEYAKIMWQLPMLNGRYNRFGDIWAGLFAKAALDQLGDVMVINGEASVRHERASDPVKNLEREAPGIPVNEDLWEHLGGSDYQKITESAFHYFKTIDHEYAIHFRDARDRWLRLFS